MFKWFCRLLFRLNGWESVGEELVQHRRCVVVAAPHTSNWDLIYMLATFDIVGLPVKFTIKRSWMRFPLNLLIEPVGGLAIDRRPREETGERPSMVEAMISLFEEREGDLALAITPEGTRSLRTRWKSGFYHVATGADLPILLGFLDYEKKQAGVGKIIYPSGDYEADMREIMDFYKDIAPHTPANYSVDQRFVGAEDGAVEESESEEVGEPQPS